MTVTLTINEVVMAATIGVMRRASALKNGFKDRHGFSGDHWQRDIEGACGECALAKYLNVHWCGGVNTFKHEGDVADVEVRTAQEDNHSLIIRKDDKPNSVYWLVTGIAPTYRIRGWITARDGMRQEWLKDWAGRPPAFFVPQSALTLQPK